MNTDIVEYGITDAALVELKSKFSIVPDAKTDKGYADIKSALKIISPYRTGIESKRKELKADSLARGRLIDAEAKRITLAIVGIEAPFKEAKQAQDDKIKAIEAARAAEEAEHIAAIEQKVNDIRGLVDGLVCADVEELKSRLEIANSIIVNNVEFEELIEDAKEAMSDTVRTLEFSLVKRKAFEEQEAEQEKRQKEMDKKQAELDAQQAVIDKHESEQRQKERDNQIAKEAEERATKAAELRASETLAEAVRREQDLKDEAERVKREASELEQRLKDEAEAKIQREKDEAEKRENNRKHKAKINNEAIDDLVAGGMNKTNAKLAVTLIAKREVANVTISY